MHVCSFLTCSNVALVLYVLPVVATAIDNTRASCNTQPTLYLTHAFIYYAAMHLLEVYGLSWLAWLLTLPPVTIGYVVGPLVPYMAQMLRPQTLVQTILR